MRQIELSQGQVAIVDDEDFAELSKHKWYAFKKEHTFYAVRNSPRDPVTNKQSTIMMHREIMNAPKGMEVDHRKHDGLDNRRENLRVCSRAENGRNQRSQSNCSSQLKGVSWQKKANKWLSQIRINGNQIYLGCFNNETEAAKAYDKKAEELFGEFANTNF